MEADDTEMADDNAKTDEAANKADDQQDDAESDRQELINYCLALEEERRWLSMQGQLLSLFDSVLKEADVSPSIKQ